MDRREFLKMLATVSAGFALFGCRDGVLGDGVKARSPSLSDFEQEVGKALLHMKPGYALERVPMPGALTAPGASRDVRFGMAIDLDACDCCGKCVLGCIVENNIPLSSEERARLGEFMHWIEMRGGAPLMCFHCGDAPCEKVCPTGAANHTPDGLSAMMYKRCAGSRFCGANCPVQARKFNFDDPASSGRSLRFNADVPVREKGVMEKCTLCLHRLQDARMRSKTLLGSWQGEGVSTACAEACPKHAIVFGNWLDPGSALVKAARNRRLYVPAPIARLDPSVVYMRGGI